MAGEPPIEIPPPVFEGQAIPQTLILPVQASRVAEISFPDPSNSYLTPWRIQRYLDTPDAKYLIEAATRLRNTSVPIAFPTETVYGLGADATRSSAVRGIYAAKQRPADNPLIVHISSLEQLRSILRPRFHDDTSSSSEKGEEKDPIPRIYLPLIEAFWPGPLTILLPNPPSSPLAPEVTAGLSTFGARMPSSPLALLLIKTADVPIAAPSANASGKPSPTTARHVKDDLDGRIELILDGGSCDVGVESTVVDGLSDPPSVLRPGGISMEEIRRFKGWERTVKGYRDGAQGAEKPKAPGMKYRHYAPKAKVVLLGHQDRFGDDVRPEPGAKKIGLLRTRDAPLAAVNGESESKREEVSEGSDGIGHARINGTTPSNPSPLTIQTSTLDSTPPQPSTTTILSIHLGSTAAQVAQNLFAGLRALDHEGVETIYVEGIDDNGGDAAAAVMNRLRKAAERSEVVDLATAL